MVVTLALPSLALDGQVGIHDPSTVVECDGKYYVWGTGGSGLVSKDESWVPAPPSGFQAVAWRF